MTPMFIIIRLVERLRSPSPLPLALRISAHVWVRLILRRDPQRAVCHNCNLSCVLTPEAHMHMLTFYSRTQEKMIQYVSVAGLSTPSSPWNLYGIESHCRLSSVGHLRLPPSMESGAHLRLAKEDQTSHSLIHRRQIRSDLWYVRPSFTKSGFYNGKTFLLLKWRALLTIATRGER